jgi:chromate transporter
MMKEYLEIFTTFSKIGAFTIGGGYAMIPVIQYEVVDRKRWVSKDEFADLLAISQSAPGILAINISIFIGEKIKGVKGSIVAAVGTALPSFLIILAIAAFFSDFKDNEIVERMFKGMRPVVVALIAVPVFSLAKGLKLNRYTSFIPVISVLLIVLLGISPVWIIMAGGLLGVFYFYYFTKR